MSEDNSLRERFLKTFKDDFVPAITRLGPAAPETRTLNALEYSAYQLGQINQSLRKIVEILEKTATDPSSRS